MILDAEQTPPKPDLESDVCIVGAGAAGIALARALAAQGRSVSLLEGGGLQPEAFSNDLYEGEVATSPLAHTSSYLTASRLRYFGGSTNHWTGWCRPLDPLDFEARPWIPHSGWPIGRAELDPYYRRAAALLQIEAFDRASEHATVRPEPDFPDADSAFERARFQLSPPTRFGTVYREELSQSRTTSVLLHANVVRIETDASGARVSHVEAKTPAGRSFRVGAESFVLATGGIENARMLLVSNGSRPEGLGNGYDRVGRFFMDHPHVTAGYAALSAPVGWFDAFDFHRPAGSRCDAIDVLTLTEGAQRRQLLPNLDVYLQRPKRELPEEARRAVRAFAAVGGLASLERPVVTTETSLRVRLEPLPNPESRVVLDTRKDALGVPRARLHWRLTESDALNLDAGLGALTRELGRARFGRAQQPEVRTEPWPSTNFGAHHLGTTRMHADPRRGVVDANCRVHDVANLYIAGSSVFTTAGAANPTLTIVALALRLADHLGGGVPLMKPDLPLTRRTLLRLLGTRAILLGMSSTGVATLGCGPEPDPRALDAVLDALVAGRALGRSYLADHSMEQSEDALRDRLLPEPESSWATLPKAALASRLLTQMDSDFEHGQVVRVEGWVISRVEARLFALAALRAPRTDDARDAGPPP